MLAPTRGTVTHQVRVTFTRGAYRRVTIDIYRTDAAGKPQLATTRNLSLRHLHSDSVLWNGKIGTQPAPAGTYLVGITAQDLACNQATWPTRAPPCTRHNPERGRHDPLPERHATAHTNDLGLASKRRDRLAELELHLAAAPLGDPEGARPRLRTRGQLEDPPAHAAAPGRAVHAHRARRGPARGGAVGGVAGGRLQPRTTVCWSSCRC